jgi:hypothetical protein
VLLLVPVVEFGAGMRNDTDALITAKGLVEGYKREGETIDTWGELHRVGFQFLGLPLTITYR